MSIFPALVPELDVSDLHKSVAFYGGYGFRILYDRPTEGFAYLRCEGADLMLQHADGPGRRWRTAPLERPHGRGINLQITVADVETLWAHALDAEHSVVLPLEEQTYVALGAAYQVRQFVVADPDGYLLRFAQDLMLPS